MDANMMKIAMEQMRKMNPEQLQSMMQNLPPDAMNQAMAQMKDMKPEEWERAKQEMSSMDPDTLARQAAQAQAQLASRTQYVLNASTQLKSEGNELHGRGAYKDAAQKYERAKSNVESFTSKEAKDLVRACTLNLSSCYLHLMQYDKCLEQCNQVLIGEPDNFKALYRRGQAYLGASDCVLAVSDLERALRSTLQSDPSQAQPVREKLQEAMDKVGALRAAGKLPPAEPKPAAIAPASSRTSPPAAALASTSPAWTSSAAGYGSSGSGRLATDPEMMARATEMLQANPGMLKQAQEMVRGFSDEQLRTLSEQMGVAADPKVLREGLGNMDPHMMAKVAQMQAELPPELRGPEAARDPERMKRLADYMARKPELAETMGQVLSSMDPEKLQEVSRAAGLPPGVTITHEMAKMAAESFKNMSPQEVQEAMQTAAKMQPMHPSAIANDSAGGSSGPGTSGREACAVSDPGVLQVDPRATAEMLEAMCPEDLEAMSKMVPGMDKMQLTPEMAKMAAKMMKGMTDKDIARMQQMAAAMQGTGAAAAVASAPAAAASVAAASGFSPDLASAAAEMMKNMGPEDIARMQEMAVKMGLGSGSASGDMAGIAQGLAGGAGADAAMASMFSNPKAMESAILMMKNMDPEALSSMMMSSGMFKDRAQAEVMARQMASMDDSQLRMMMKAANTLQSARMAGERTLAWARANILLVTAVLVLLLALLLRWLGYM